MQTTAGRVSEFLRAIDGTMVSGCSLSQFVVASRPTVRQAQIIQDQVDHVLFRIVKGSGYTDSDEQSIRSKAAEFLGSEMNCEFEYVESIPQESSGKYRLTICQLKNRPESPESR
jgi:phenylacetate-CoA ligase